MIMRLSSLHIYPIKSTRGLERDAAVVEPWGLEHDRRWMVVDETGQNITARTEQALFTITATPGLDGELLLTAPERPVLRVPAPVSGEPVTVGLSRLDRALSAGAAADAWVSAVLSRAARLVWLDDPQRRQVGTHHGGTSTDVMNLADAGPLLLTSTASLAQLNDWIAADLEGRSGKGGGQPDPEPLPMMRFRPNVVIDADRAGELRPFAEDTWATVRIGDVRFRTGELCDRCVMTTVDHRTLARGKEPIRTLARHRRRHGSTWFGSRLIPVTIGTIRVGDPVSVP
jgi:uncharacterized protein YcbX